MSQYKDVRYITHLIAEKDWHTAQAQGEYRPASLETEGFIHFSREDQVLEVANFFYRDVKPLLLLWVSVSQLAAPLQWEPAAHPEAVSDHKIPDAMIFPHLYGPLNLNAVIGVMSMTANEAGVLDTVPIPPGI